MIKKRKMIFSYIIKIQKIYYYLTLLTIKKYQERGESIMKSMEIITNMLCDAREFKNEQLVYNIAMLISETIKETVPQLVREELRKIQEDLVFNVKTYINGKQTDIPAVEDEVRKLIENEIKKARIR